MTLYLKTKAKIGFIWSPFDYKQQMYINQKQHWKQRLTPPINEFYIRCNISQIVDGQVVAGVRFNDGDWSSVTFLRSYWLKSSPQKSLCAVLLLLSMVSYRSNAQWRPSLPSYPEKASTSGCISTHRKEKKLNTKFLLNISWI